MQQNEDLANYDSDETMVEGSILGSDSEEDELHLKRLIFVSKEASFTSPANSVNEPRVLGYPSPEFRLMHRLNEKLPNVEKQDQKDQMFQVNSETEESQSLLNYGMNCLFFPGKIFQPCIFSNNQADSKLEYSKGLEVQIPGFSQRSDEDETSLDTETTLPTRASIVMITSAEELKKKSLILAEEMTSQNLFDEDYPNHEVTMSETVCKLKDQSLLNSELDTGRSPELPSMIAMKTSAGQNLLHRDDGELKVADLLRPLNDIESPGDLSALTDIFTCQSDVPSIHSSANKKSSTLPPELVTALNALPQFVQEPLSQMKTNAVLKNTTEERTEHLKQMSSLFQMDEDCTQITEITLDPRFPDQQDEQLQELTESQFWDKPDNQILSGECNSEMLTSSHTVSSCGIQTKEGKSSLVEMSLSKEAKENSFITRKSARKRNQSKCSCCGTESFVEYGSFFPIHPETKKRITQRTCNFKHQTSNAPSEKDVREKHVAANPDKSKLTLTRAEAFHPKNTCHKKISQPKRRCTAETGSEICPSLSLGVINRRNIFGETQLHKAAMEEDAYRVHAMIKAGANINMQDYAGWTALHEASATGSYKTVKVLLEAGADVNCKGSGQITAIHDAARDGHYEVAQLLLHYGADPLLQDENGKCALQEANDNNMKCLLLSYISKSKRSLITAKKSIRIQELNRVQRANSSNVAIDTNQQKVEVNSKERFEHVGDNCHTALNKACGNREQTKRDCSESSTIVQLLRKLDDARSLNDHDSRVAPTKVIQSTTDSVKFVGKKTGYTQKDLEEINNCTSLKSQQKRKINTHDKASDLVQNKINNVDASDSFKRVTRSATLKVCRAEKACQETEKSFKSKRKKNMIEKNQLFSITEQAEKQIANEKNPSVKLRNTAANSENTVVSLQNLHKVCATSPCKDHIMHSGYTELTQSADVHLVTSLQEIASLPLVTTIQHCKNYDNNKNDQHKKDDRHSDKLKKPEKTKNADLDREENAFPTDKKNSPHEQRRKGINNDLGFDSLEKCSAMEKDPHNEFTSNSTVIVQNLNESKTTSDSRGQNDNYNIKTSKNKENKQSVPQSITFLGDISLQGKQLELAKLTTLEQETASPSDLVIEEINESTEPKVCNTISNALQGCIEETPLANMGKLASHEFSGTVAGPTASESKEHYNNVIPFIHLAASQVTVALNDNNRENSWISKTKEKSVCHNSVTVVQETDPVTDKKATRHPQERKKCAKNTNTNSCHQTQFQHTTEQEPPKKTDVQPSDTIRSVRDSSDSVIPTDFPSFSHGYITREKYGKHLSISAVLHDIEERQKTLQLSELSTPKNADQYIQELSQIQETLNEVLIKQKAERDVLAKKYRSSVDSFKQGALREQLAKLASMQRSLLNIAQKQKELGQKIKAYENMKRIHSKASRVQITNSSVLHKEHEDGKDTNRDQVHSSPVITVNMGLSVNPTNVCCTETHLSAQSKFSSQEHGQCQDSYFSDIRAKETDGSKEVSANTLKYQTRLEVHSAGRTLQTNMTGVERTALPSKHLPCNHSTECSQPEISDHSESSSQANQFHNSESVSSMLNISEARSGIINENIHQSTTECQQGLPTDQNLQGSAHMKISHQQHPKLSETVLKSFSNNQKNICLNRRILLNDNLGRTEQLDTLHSGTSGQRSEPHSSKEQQMGCTTEGKKKKIQLIDLIKQGKIKPGDDVLEFRLQDSGYKATLLWDGSIRTSSSKIFRSPVQWVKAILGDEISVNWKYVLNKVTYLGRQLSTFISEEAFTTQKSALQSQQKHPEETSRQPDLIPASTHILQLNKILLISNQEFLPCHIMDQHWKHYMDCDDLTFWEVCEM